MRPLTLLALFHFLINVIYAQRAEKTPFSFSDYKKELIELTFSDTLTQFNIPSQRLKVIDARCDTNTIGFSEPYYLDISGTARPAIEKYLNLYLGSSNGDSGSRPLVVFIKRIWFTSQQKLAPQQVNHGDDDKGLWLPGFSCRIECYYNRNDLFYPVFRYDTTFTIEGKLRNEAPGILSHCMQRVADKILETDKKQFNENGKRLTWTEVDKYNNDKYDLPVLKDKVLVRGVYRNFQEFQQNKPSYANFEVRKDKKADILYVTDSTGGTSAIRTIWGYCDGTKPYIKSADNYFPMYRVGKTFYLKGFKGINRDIGLNAGNIFMSGLVFGTIGRQNKQTNYSVDYKPYQLDILTGDIF